jgi:hypothetical protein
MRLNLRLCAALALSLSVTALFAASPAWADGDASGTWSEMYDGPSCSTSGQEGLFTDCGVEVGVDVRPLGVFAMRVQRSDTPSPFYGLSLPDMGLRLNRFVVHFGLPKIGRDGSGQMLIQMAPSVDFSPRWRWLNPEVGVAAGGILWGQDRPTLGFLSAHVGVNLFLTPAFAIGVTAERSVVASSSFWDGTFWLSVDPPPDDD